MKNAYLYVCSQCRHLNEAPKHLIKYDSTSLRNQGIPNARTVKHRTEKLIQNP
jgi:hypothetical protein